MQKWIVHFGVELDYCDWHGGRLDGSELTGHLPRNLINF